MIKRKNQNKHDCFELMKRDIEELTSELQYQRKREKKMEEKLDKI